MTLPTGLLAESGLIPLFNERLHCSYQICPLGVTIKGVASARLMACGARQAQL